MNFRYASASDDLRPLWNECFPEERDWVSLFIKEQYAPEDAIVAVEDRNIAGMVHFGRESLSYHGREIPVVCMFGLGVHPDFRGRGLARELAARLMRASAQEGAPLVEVSPHSEQGRKFARSIGFEDTFFLTREKFGREDVSKAEEPVEPIDPDGAFKANALYEKVLAYRDHMHRSAASWRFEALAAEITGGRMLGVRRDGELCGYAIYKKYGGAVCLHEVFAEDETAYDSLRLAVLNDAGVESAEMDSPACPHSAIPSAMLRAADPAAVLAIANEYRPFECSLEVEDTLVPENSARYAVGADGVSRSERSAGVYITPGQLVKTIMSAGPAPYANLLFY